MRDCVTGVGAVKIESFMSFGETWFGVWAFLCLIDLNLSLRSVDLNSTNLFFSKGVRF